MASTSASGVSARLPAVGSPRLWSELEPDGHPLHRCAVAHFMADVHDDVHEELAWDLRAIEAADSVSDEELRLAGMTTSVRSLYPSLHLNLGDAYRRLGEVDRALEQLERGYASVYALGDDGYGRMIKSGLDRLATRLEAD